MSAFLHISQLALKYHAKQHWILDHIDLEVYQGEFLALIGESGSGKTTLLRSIAGLERPQEGSIQLNDTYLQQAKTFVKAEKRNIGMVFQDYALFPHLTVKKNILFGVKDKSRREERLNAMLQLTGLTGLENRYPHQLSGGQQQRVALARALAPEPKVLLMDEPFSNLDESLKERVRMEIRDIIKQAGITAIFVTHDIRDALSVADRVAILKDGKIAQIDQPQVLFDQPNSIYTARFLGAFNLFSEQISNLLDCKKYYPNAIKLGVRPDKISLSPRNNIEHFSIKMRLKSSQYLGMYMALRFYLNEDELLVHYHGTKSSWEQGEEYELFMPVSSVLAFGGNE